MNNMFYKKRLIYSCLPVLLAIASCFLFSCQKELNGITASSGAGGTGGGTGSGPTTNMKPKLGTKWYYRYYKWNAGGGLNEFHDVTYKANSEDILGGETWLNIIDSLSNITVFLLNEKTGGLYQ